MHPDTRDPAVDLRQLKRPGNLADKAGGVQVTVEAETTDGFDLAWLRNAVLEPLEEADVRVLEE